MKQTAVEWLISELKLDSNSYLIEHIIKQAKAMEKEQIAKAWNDGDYVYFYSKQTGKEFDNGEEYYNEIYGNISKTKH